MFFVLYFWQLWVGWIDIFNKYCVLINGLCERLRKNRLTFGFEFHINLLINIVADLQKYAKWYSLRASYITYFCIFLFYNIYLIIDFTTNKIKFIRGVYFIMNMVFDNSFPNHRLHFFIKVKRATKIFLRHCNPIWFERRRRRVYTRFDV